MRTILPLAVLMTAASFAALGAQDPQPLGSPVHPAGSCGAALVEDATAEWLSEAPLLGDFTLDGEPDAAIWGVADDRLILMVERCEAGRPAQRWRFPLALGASCDARSVRVAAASLLLDDDVVERVCARGEQRDECIHLRRENDRRRALTAAGARQIRVEGPACTATSLVWDEQRGGFMAMPRRRPR